MKVLLINTVNLEANGISTFIINSAKIMVKSNIEVTLLAPNCIDSQLKKVLFKNGINLKQIPNRMSDPIKYFFKLKCFLTKENFDVVHVNGNSTTMAVELFAAKLAKVKVRIAHSHNTITEHPIINKILRPLFEFSVNGRLACNEAAGKWLFKNKHFVIIQNGIDLSSYQYNFDKRKEYRQKLKVKETEILLGHVGEFNYQKNQSFLIEIIKKLPDKYKLLLIGEGKNYIDLQNKVNELGLKKRVILTGVIDNVFDYLNAIDLFLLPSRFEGQPFVLIEATASGLNCMVSNNVSKEVNLTNNIIFNVLNTNNWIKLIQSNMLISKNRDIKSKKAINELCKQGYSTKDNIDKLIKYYKKYEY